MSYSLLPALNQYTILCCEKGESTFLFGDEVLDNDIGHAVSVSIAVFVKAMNRAEDELEEGNGPILAAQHLDRR